MQRPYYHCLIISVKIKTSKEVNMFRRIINLIKRFFEIPYVEDPRISKNNKLYSSYFVEMDEDYRRRTAPGLNADPIIVFHKEDH